MVVFGGVPISANNKEVAERAPHIVTGTPLFAPVWSGKVMVCVTKEQKYTHADTRSQCKTCGGTRTKTKTLPSFQLPSPRCEKEHSFFFYIPHVYILSPQIRALNEPYVKLIMQVDSADAGLKTGLVESTKENYPMIRGFVKKISSTLLHRPVTNVTMEGSGLLCARFGFCCISYPLRSLPQATT
jgi:hypothetical protein